MNEQDKSIIACLAQRCVLYATVNLGVRPAQNRFLATFLGFCVRTIALIRLQTQKFARTREYQQASVFLLDTQPAQSKLSLSEIGPLIQCHGSVPRPFKIAIVANQPLGQAAHFEKDCRDADLNVIVFNALHPACTWLGLDLIETNQAIRRKLKKA